MSSTNCVSPVTLPIESWRIGLLPIGQIIEDLARGNIFIDSHKTKEKQELGNHREPDGEPGPFSSNTLAFDFYSTVMAIHDLFGDR